jgi:hypothetical protein
MARTEQEKLEPQVYLDQFSELSQQIETLVTAKITQTNKLKLKPGPQKLLSAARQPNLDEIIIAFAPLVDRTYKSIEDEQIRLNTTYYVGLFDPEQKILHNSIFEEEKLRYLHHNWPSILNSALKNLRETRDNIDQNLALVIEIDE